MRRLASIFACCCAALLGRCADYDLLDDEDGPDPVTLEIVAASDSSVTIRWTRCRDDDFRQYEVYYGTGDVVDRGDRLADSLSFSVDTVKTVQPLDDLTRYFFRVIVYDDRGKFSVSNIVDTVTPEDRRGKLTLAAASAGEEGEVLLHWTGSVVETDRYVIHGDTLATVDTADTALATVYSDTTETIRSLSPGHTWRFRVFAWRDSTIVASSNTAVLDLPPDD